jgi:glutathione S-transferase
MANLKVYGVPQSRAARTLWMVEECGVPYELVSTHFAKDTKTDAYKAINPNSRVPAIDDDGVIVWESMAINLYLAKKYGGDLAPKNLADEAHAIQWSFWVMTEIEKPLLNALFARTGMMGMAKDEAQAMKYFDEIRKPLAVLNAHLAKNEYILGSRFTVADLNVACVLNWATAGRFSLADYPKVEAWLGTCAARPAAQKARAIR